MATDRNSYKDPYWTDLASQAEKKTGLPTGLLTSIVQYGEKTNADRVSNAGAKTVFQIIPSTRNAFLKKYGVDAYLNEANAAEVAALHLKESLDRNKGDVEAAIGEYHGGPNRSNWGKVNTAYRQRVLTGLDEIQASSPETQKLTSDFQTWFNTQRTDSNEQAAADSLLANPPTTDTKPTPEMNTSAQPTENDDALTQGFQSWLANQPTEQAPAEQPGLLARAADTVTGNLRETPQSQSLPEWTGMPELNQLSMASAKTGLGTMFAAPDEIAQVIKANFPNTQISKDEKGNFLFKSSIDGKDYVVPPGFSIGDIPRAIGGIAAFTPAGKATSILGGAASAAATQAAIEGSQAATGGSFDPAAIATTGVVGGVAPPLMKGVQAVGNVIANPVKGALNKVMGRGAPAVVDEATQGVDRVIVSGLPDQPAPPVTQAAAPSTANAYTAARQASQGNESALKDLASTVTPDKKIMKSAKDLEIDDYLQPDHISTNQEYIELAQVLKSVPTSQLAISEKEGLAKVAKRADTLIDELGGSSDLSSVSNKIKNEISATEKKLKGDAGKIYDEIDAKLVKQEIAAPADSTLDFIKQRAKELGGENNLTAGEREIIKKLTPQNGKQPTYGLLDQVRKDIGEAKRNSQTSFGTSDSKLLGKLEDVLRTDQGLVADAHGLGEKWAAARSLTRTYKGLQDDLTALFGKTIDQSLVGDLSGAVNALPKGDPSKFIKLIKSVPENMRQELTASGLATAFSKNKGGLNFNNYNQWFEGLLKNKQSYVALMANLPPSSRKSLTDLYRVSKGVSRSISTKVPTGRLTEGVKRLEGADTLTGKILEAARYDLGANLAGAASGTAASAVGGPIIGGSVGLFVRQALSKGPKLPGVQAAEKLILSPEFKEAVNTAAAGNSKQAAKKLSKSPIFVDFIKKSKITDLNSLSARERWILQSLESGSGNQQSR